MSTNGLSFELTKVLKHSGSDMSSNTSMCTFLFTFFDKVDE